MASDDEDQPESEAVDSGVEADTSSDEPEQIEPADNAVTDPDEAGEDEKPNDEPAEPKGPNLLHRLLTKYKAKKKITIPATVLIFLLLVFGIPTSRYFVLGLAIKKDFSIIVLDSKTNVPVSGVEINLRGKQAKTDGEGKATLERVSVGPATLSATKNYYKDGQVEVSVPLGSQRAATEIKLEATGRQVPVHIINKLSGDNLSGAVVKAAGTEAQTDKNGETTIVLPPDLQTADAEISLGGFNTLKVEIKVSELAVKDNTFGLTTSGKIYFLSKRTGKIDVMKSDLDGSNPTVIVKATGNEDESDTILLASRDWKYLAFKSRREGEKGRLYLIDTTTDKLVEVDGSNDVNINFSGWSGHNFIYQVNRETLPIWKSNGSALKSYNAENGQIAIIDQTKAEGSGDYEYVNESFGTIHILNNQVVYSKYWGGNPYGVYNLANKRNGIYSVLPTGTGKQLVKDFPVNVDNDGYVYSYIGSTQSEPNEIYFSIQTSASTSYYTYDGTNLTPNKEMNDEKFYSPYPTFLASPNNEQTFWYEERDGKNTLFVGDRGGNNGKEIDSASEYKPYGWFTDSFLLVSKSDSELYIMPTTGLGQDKQPIKITNYHRPTTYFYNYGGGYGGI